MADLNVSGGTPRIDTEKWKRLTPQEIIKEESKGEEIPAEIITWAQQMIAFSKIPDNVTYERVDGDVGIDALDKLGIEDEDALNPEANNAARGVKTEEPGAVKEPERTEGDVQLGEEELPPPPAGQASDTEPDDNETPEIEDFSLADESITANPEEIRKRKERKGIPQ